MRYLIVDESGTLPDKNEGYFIVAGIVIDNIRRISKIFSKIEKNSPIDRHYTNKKTSEFFIKRLNAFGIADVAFVDSNSNRYINAADFIAGYIRTYLRTGNTYPDENILDNTYLHIVAWRLLKNECIEMNI